MQFPFLRSSGRRARGAVVVAVILTSVSGVLPQRALAVVLTAGNVSPAIPQAGINTNTHVYIGDTSYGQLSNGPTQANPNPTSIVVTGASNNVIIGDDAGVTGSAAFTGLQFDLSAQNNLALGIAGFGSLSMSAQSRASFGGDVVLGTADGSSGRLFVNDLGTMVQAQNTIFVGYGGVGLIQALSGSRVFSTSSTIGFNATSDGTVTVSGNDTLWRQTGAMTIGASGRGYMQVVSQARMETGAVTVASAGTSVGSANVSGNGSIWEVDGALTLGVSGVASLDINQGGRLSNTGATSLATMAGGEATALVSGTGSVWNAGTSLNVGAAGSGILRVFGGGRVNAANTILANTSASRGEVSVDGSGTVFDVTGTLDVGNTATAEGFLSVSGGGVVNTTGALRVAGLSELFLSGGRVNAGGGLTNNGLVQGGGRINGAVTNAASGEMRSRPGASLIFGNTLSNAGLVELNGGELEALGATTNTGDIAVRSGAARFGGGLSNNSGGQLAAVGGNVDVFGNVNNAAGAQIVVGGGATAVFHDVVTNNGQIFVQPGSNILMLENLSFTPTSLLSLTLGEESLEEELVPLEVGGQATLAGQLNVQLGSAVTPQLGDSFQLVSASGGLTGTFAGGSLPTLSSGLEWDLDYTSTSVTLSVVAGTGGPSADFDGDGDVDGADLNVWRGDFATAGPQADADGDGDADGADFLAWQRQVGSTAAAPAANPIPEPASGVMLSLVLAAAATRMRRA